jgi:hypothetical protein
MDLNSASWVVVGGSRIPGRGGKVISSSFVLTMFRLKSCLIYKSAISFNFSFLYINPYFYEEYSQVDKLDYLHCALLSLWNHIRSDVTN